MAFEDEQLKLVLLESKRLPSCIQINCRTSKTLLYWCARAAMFTKPARLKTSSKTHDGLIDCLFERSSGSSLKFLGTHKEMGSLMAMPYYTFLTIQNGFSCLLDMILITGCGILTRSYELQDCLGSLIEVTMTTCAER